MSLRKNIAMCVENAATPDEAARLICGYLSTIGLADEGNGWFDNDADMAMDLARAEGAYREMRKAQKT